MHRRRVRYILDVLLLAAAVVVILTGLLVDQLDLNEFTPHRWAGYVVAVLITIHVGLHWRWFLPSRRVDRQRREPGPCVPIDSAAQAAEPANLPFVAEPGAVGGGPASAAGGQGRSHPTRRAAITAVGAGVAGVVVGWSAKSQVSPDPYPGGDVGLFYHRQSSLGLRGLVRDLVDWGRRPAPYLRVGDAEIVTLPAVRTPPAMSVAQALEQRRSLREYADRAMTARGVGLGDPRRHRDHLDAGLPHRPVGRRAVPGGDLCGGEPGRGDRPGRFITSTSGPRPWSRCAVGRSPGT